MPLEELLVVLLNPDLSLNRLFEEFEADDLE